MTPEQKQKMADGREKAKAEKEANFVSKNDFNDFKSSVVGILENISNKLNDQAEPERKVMMVNKEQDKKVVGQNSPSNEEVVHNLGAVWQEYEDIFNKYFDQEDGFKGMLKGVNFKISVPLKLSNAQEAHIGFYKSDIRHKVLDGHDLEGSLEKYCKLVCQNLNYKRNIKLKI
jgi:hypothetical protein